MRICSVLFGFAVLAAVLCYPTDVTAQKKKRIALTDPKEAGPDFLVQGEYYGKHDDHEAGAQVIAHGDGNFTVTLLPGGLPGKGWEGKIKLTGKAKTEGGKTVFKIKNASKRAIEWEILQGYMVVEERENIIPGFVQNLTATLTPGDYGMTCGLLSNPKGTLKVTADAEPQK